MHHLTLPAYQDYLNARLEIITERHLICQEILKTQTEYDYWTYNYLYYLYALNAESLNHLRYLFRKTPIFRLEFYNLLTLGSLKFCLNLINYHGIPKDRTSRTMKAFVLNHPDKVRIFIPNFSLPVVTPTQLPPAFEKVEASLTELIAKEDQLTLTYKDI